ncbi:AAA-domain-containing protein [Lepidopterella palustris CBS 459.81]|uniref:AAA-domain-containing protein n=1 Tax=Lepidopterella palustris CBS 459.81 TaxID=1314670 RepID=A0A8E2JHW3_9PEZI|nr:AAA-domain-containing protein [Lepidopterella palustris CBS 459.81]
MSHRPKRRLDIDPLASDPEDLDYGAESPVRAQKRRSKPSSTGQRRGQKRQRVTYRDSDGDIVEDDDSIDDDDSFASERSEEEFELNPKTGRGVRSAAKKVIKYEELSDDDIEDTSSEDDDDLAPSPQKGKTKARKSLIVRLKMRPQTRSTRARTGSKSVKKGTTPEVLGTRRSSRLSHDVEEPILALTDSGKNVQVIRPGTRSPSPRPTRQTRGAKGLKKLPSAIMEASQEVSAESIEHEHTPGPLDALIADTQVLASEPGTQVEADADAHGQVDEEAQMEGVIQESDHGGEADESDEGPVTRGGRQLRSRGKAEPPASTRSPRKRKGMDESSDFEPTAEDEKGDENISESDSGKMRDRRGTSDESGSGRRSARLRGKAKNSHRSRHNSDSDENDSQLDPDELAEEAEELAPRKRRRITRQVPPDDQLVYDTAPKLRARNNKPAPDYRLFRPEVIQQLEDDDAAAPLPPPRKGGRAYRSLFSTQGPFGGGAESLPFPGPHGPGAAGGVDSDSSDDDTPQRPPRVGGAIGMTPTAATAPNILFPPPQNADAQQTGSGGGPANFGKVKDKKALADADPLGVDPNVNFEGVGGLDGHINQLKEMVALPLLYPEVFQRFHVTPPRGVLFHGPPGTGKTLLARALASSVSSQGKKVTFYMRKGADALSKWVGEAERQLRLLFEEARKNQPSIIFFDEIDGLAPVRSSKQEQIHASIVATLLALMDGMDGRGQVIVIGATNRPDSVDPALRRPGRFDREFYFPLPNVEGRRAIIEIHTKNWDPPLKHEFKDQLAELTKGYGGADLRALCTEAALNAVQGTYPQIYQSDKKLIIDPSAIKVLAKDFMISVNKMIPSSERTVSSGAAPLTKGIAPLLRTPLEEVAKILDEIIPQKKKLTALEEAQFDDREDEKGFERESMQRAFESGRIFRPRLLITGLQGMGQQYLGAALLNKFEGLHVQSFDLPTLLEDSARSPEAAVIQLFKEVRRHKPSVIYIPNVDVWYQTVEPKVIKIFTSLLRSLPPNDPVLVLGILELANESEKPDPAMLRDLFGFSTKNQFSLRRPNENAREEFFEGLVKYIRMPPADFPNLENRKKRKLAELEVAPEIEAPKPVEDPAELKRMKKHDRLILNTLKMQIQPVMEQLKKSYRRYFKPIIPEESILYLFDEQNPSFVNTDLPEHQRQEQGMVRPFELAKDAKGVPGLRHVETGKFYYNLDLTIIERRLSNGYYKRPKDFVVDIKTITKDARTFGDPDRTIKANEMLTNVEVDMATVATNNPGMALECEGVWQREQERARKAIEKDQAAMRKAREEAQRNAGGDTARTALDEDTGNVASVSIAPGAVTATSVRDELFGRNAPLQTSGTTTATSGPVVLGEQIPGVRTLPPVTPVRPFDRTGPLSNGTSTGDGSNPHQSNGSTVPSRVDEDSHMADSQDVGSGPQETHEWQTPGGPGTQAQRSQISGRTFMAPNSHPGEYHNSASTTTSGQKTSDRSNRSSGQQYNTQSTNGVSGGQHPDFASMMPQGLGSQIPDTQELTYISSQMSNSQPSQSSQQHQFPMSAPPRQAPSINSILNSENPQLILDEIQLSNLHRELVKRSSGLSVEQLEQVNAVLMDAIWKSRSEWNRNNVIQLVANAFNDTIKDIEHIQTMLPPSQKEDELEGYPTNQRQRERLYRLEEQTQFGGGYQQGGGQRDLTQYS